LVAKRIRTVALLALTVALAILPGAAGAEDVSTAEFADRVDQAIAGDESALRAVTAIAGTPVDGEALVAGEPALRQNRLDTLHQLLQSAPADLDADALRRQAEAIVTNPPYSAELAADNGVFARIIAFLGRLFGNDAARGLALLVVALITLAVAIPLLNRIATRRQPNGPRPVAAIQQRPSYEAAAEEAAGRGDFAAAIRMLFLDGVEHLEAHRAVPDAGTTSTATVRQISGDEAFLDRFDEIAYGGSPAGFADVGEARSGWQRLKRKFT
jgi:hypothetical protein